jgi:hypothetical protein
VGVGASGRGNAALEARLDYLASAGDLLAVRSAMMEVTGKTLRFAHFLHDLRSGTMIATNETVAAMLDLDARRLLHAAGGDLLTVFYSNLYFHRALFGLCRNACLIETIEHLAYLQQCRAWAQAAGATLQVYDVRDPDDIARHSRRWSSIAGHRNIGATVLYCDVSDEAMQKCRGVGVSDNANALLLSAP